jgi:hypothetical protein
MTTERMKLASETHADELARLVEEWRTGEGSEREEAWNLIADFTCCNYDLIVAALRAPEADAGAVAWQWRVHFHDGWMAWINGDIQLATYREEHARGIASGKIEIRELYASPTAAGVAAPPAAVREVPHEDCLNCRCEPDQQCAGVVVRSPEVAPAASADAVRAINQALIAECADYLDKLEQELIGADADMLLEKSDTSPSIWADKLRALSAPVAGADAGMRYRHIKRGSTYTVVGEARIQSDEPLFDMSDVVIYRCDEHGGLWARPPAEFNDGRFEALPASGEADIPNRQKV